MPLDGLVDMMIKIFHRIHLMGSYMAKQSHLCNPLTNKVFQHFLQNTWWINCSRAAHI